MSRKINVNPGQYKVRGRERQGEEIPHAEQRTRMALAERRQRSEARPDSASRSDTASKTSKKSVVTQASGARKRSR